MIFIRNRSGSKAAAIHQRYQPGKRLPKPDFNQKQKGYDINPLQMKRKRNCNTQIYKNIFEVADTQSDFFNENYNSVTP